MFYKAMTECMTKNKAAADHGQQQLYKKSFM
jgi:hypothetical protein